MPRHKKRVILIDVRFENGKIVEEILLPGTSLKMSEKDNQHKSELTLYQGLAKTNTENVDKLQPGEVLEGGSYVYQRGWDKSMEPQYPHPGLHVSYLRDEGNNEIDGDEIVWLSTQGHSFEVHIQRDPELVFIPDDFDRRPTPTKNSKTKLDNPFKTDFPLVSIGGEPVSSGPPDKSASKRSKIIDQQYYKFSIKLDGIAEILDPHIEMHDGDD